MDTQTNTQTNAKLNNEKMKNKRNVRKSKVPLQANKYKQVTFSILLPYPHQTQKKVPDSN